MIRQMIEDAAALAAIVAFLAALAVWTGYFAGL